MQIIQSIQNRIYTVRGERVMLDKDLALLYETETKFLNLSVKRNTKRFPPDFMFQLTKEEFAALRFEIEAREKDANLRLQIETSSWGGSRYLPYAFTEQGVAMLSGILNSDKAINTNIAIMRAFIEVRKVLLQQTDMREQLREIKERMGEHDTQLNQIYDAMENLLDDKAAQRKWDERQRIGFKPLSPVEIVSVQNRVCLQLDRICLGKINHPFLYSIFKISYGIHLTIAQPEKTLRFAKGGR